MIFLLLSIIALATAPIIARAFEHSPYFEDTLSSFLLVVLGGIILAELIPLSYQNGGWPVIPLSILGLIGPTLIEKAFRKAADSTHQITLLIGFSGLLLHTMVDGASLNEFESVESASQWLPLAIVLHRIPVALSVLWIIRPVFGFKAVWLALSALAMFTLFGFILGVQLESAMTSENFAWLQAFVTGTLMHVLLHRPHRHDKNNHKHDHHDHSHASHHHAHSHQLTASFRNWTFPNYLGAVSGGVTLAILAYLH